MDLTRATSQTLTCSVGGTLVVNIVVVMMMGMAMVMVITILDDDFQNLNFKLFFHAEFPACCSH